MRRATTAVLVALMAVAAGTPARADQPTKDEVMKSISQSMGSHDEMSGKTIGAFAAVVVGLALVGVVVTRRQERDEVVNGGWGSAGEARTVPAGATSRGSPGVVNNPTKLVRELMKEAGLTRAQVRQLESLNDRLAEDDRAVKHLATLLLCPSLIAAAKPEQILRAA